MADTGNGIMTTLKQGMEAITAELIKDDIFSLIEVHPADRLGSIEVRDMNGGKWVMLVTYAGPG